MKQSTEHFIQFVVLFVGGCLLFTLGKAFLLSSSVVAAALLILSGSFFYFSLRNLIKSLTAQGKE